MKVKCLRAAFIVLVSGKLPDIQLHGAITLLFWGVDKLGVDLDEDDEADDVDDDEDDDDLCLATPPPPLVLLLLVFPSFTLLLLAELSSLWCWLRWLLLWWSRFIEFDDADDDDADDEDTGELSVTIGALVDCVIMDRPALHELFDDDDDDDIDDEEDERGEFPAVFEPPPGPFVDILEGPFAAFGFGLAAAETVCNKPRWFW